MRAAARRVQRPALVKGNMQLFSVEQQRSQALEAHAAVFGTLKARVLGGCGRLAHTPACWCPACQ